MNHGLIKVSAVVGILAFVSVQSPALEPGSYLPQTQQGSADKDREEAVNTTIEQKNNVNAMVVTNSGNMCAPGTVNCNDTGLFPVKPPVPQPPVPPTPQPPTGGDNCPTGMADCNPFPQPNVPNNPPLPPIDPNPFPPPVPPNTPIPVTPAAGGAMCAAGSSAQECNDALTLPADEPLVEPFVSGVEEDVVAWAEPVTVPATPAAPVPAVSPGFFNPAVFEIGGGITDASIQENFIMIQRDLTQNGVVDVDDYEMFLGEIFMAMIDLTAELNDEPPLDRTEGLRRLEAIGVRARTGIMWYENYLRRTHPGFTLNPYIIANIQERHDRILFGIIYGGRPTRPPVDPQATIGTG